MLVFREFYLRSPNDVHVGKMWIENERRVFIGILDSIDCIDSQGVLYIICAKHRTIQNWKTYNSEIIY